MRSSQAHNTPHALWCLFPQAAEPGPITVLFVNGRKNEVFLIAKDVPSRTGISQCTVALGKEASRAHRMRYPSLPKFTFYDDDVIASAANAVAARAYAAAAASLATMPPASVMITIQLRRRSSRTAVGDYAMPNPSAVMAAAVARATAEVAWSMTSSIGTAPSRVCSTIAPLKAESNVTDSALASAAEQSETIMSTRTRVRSKLSMWFRSKAEPSAEDHATHIDHLHLQRQSSNDLAHGHIQRYDSVQDALSRFARADV